MEKKLDSREKTDTGSKSKENTRCGEVCVTKKVLNIPSNKTGDSHLFLSSVWAPSRGNGEKTRNNPRKPGKSSIAQL